MLSDNVKLNPSMEEIESVLGFQILETPMFVDHPLTGQRAETGKKTTYRIITNNDGNPEYLPLGEVGKNFQVVQNDRFIEKMVKPLLETELVTATSVGALFNGGKVFTQMQLTEIEPVPGDVYRCYLMAFNCHDGSGSIGYLSGTDRVVCRNTYRTAMNNKASLILSARHTKNVEVNIDLIREALDLVNGGFLATEEQLKRLAEVCIESEEQIKKVVKVAFSQKKLDEESSRKSRVIDEIQELFVAGKGQDIPGVKGTGLALFNAITEYTNHVSGVNRKNPSSSESRFDSVLFGQAGKINDKAKEAILALTK